MAKDDMVSQEEYQKLKDAQAGSDRTVTLMQKNNKELLAQIEGLKLLNENKDKDEAAAAEKKTATINHKMRIIELAAEKGIDIEKAFSLLGMTDLDDETLLDQHIEGQETVKQEALDKYARSMGRKGIVSNYGLAPSSDYADLNKMTEKDLKGLPAGVINRSIEAALKKGEKLKLRQRITGRA